MQRLAEQILKNLPSRGRMVGLGMAACLALAISSVSAQPANDNFANAEVITGVSGSVTGNNVGAGTEPGEPTYGGYIGASVWYRWTAPTNGNFSFDTVGSGFDTVLLVYLGNSVSSLTLIAANDDIGGGSVASRVRFSAVAGQAYNISVAGYSGLTGNITLNWAESVQAGNDYFANATVLTGGWGSTNGDNTSATSESGEPSHVGFSPSASVWYQWTAPADGEVAWDTLGSGFDTLLAVYTGTTLSSLNQVSANDDLYPFTQNNYSGQNIFNTNVTPPYCLGTLYYYSQPYGGPSGLRFNATAGTTYYIAVDGKYGVTGPYQLNWAYHPSGVFRFATENIDQTGTGMLLYQCAETESVYPSAQSIDAQTMNHTYYWYNAPGVLVTVTRVAGSSGRATVQYRTVDGDSSLLINGDQPGLAYVDYSPVSGTLVFDDFEMSKTILVPIYSDGAGYQPNRAFTIVLTNAALDSLESSEVSPPRVDPTFGKALVRILDVHIDPNGPRRIETLVTNIVDTNIVVTTNITYTLIPSNSVFNFQKVNYRVPEDVTNYWGTTPITVYVNRTGTNRSSVTLNYRINNYFVSDQAAGDEQNIEFPLQAGSDYATPDPPWRGVVAGMNSDYNAANGTIAFGDRDFRAKPIHFTIYNDQLTKFNRDFHIELYREVDGDPVQVGMVAETTVTILFDDQDPPAGSVDEYHNADFAEYMAPPIDTVPPMMNHPGADSVVYGLAVQPDDKTVIVGGFNSYNSTPRNRVARMNLDGMLDTTFNPGNGANDFISSLALYQDGRIIIGGGFTSFDGVQRNSIARINANGSLDTTFSPGLGANGTVWAVALQADGKIVIGGDFTTVGGVTRNYVAQLNSDGSLDTSFDPGTNAPNGTVYALALTASGQVIIGGEFTSLGGQSRNYIARLNADGSLDTSFDPGTGADGTIYALCWQADGKLLVGGEFAKFNGYPLTRMARLNSNGSVDSSFYSGTGADDTVYSITLQSDGKIYVGGLFTSFNGTHRLGFTRLFPDGTVDTGFLDTSYNQFAGLSRKYFDTAVEPKGFVWASGIQSDGKVMIGGGFEQVGGGQFYSDVRPSSYNANQWPEPKTRAGVRNRNNVARLIGGSTPGPGNIGLHYDTYSVNENQSFLYVTLLRTNGTLGTIGANFAVQPGVAQSGVDYVYNSPDPLYWITWDYIGPSRMHSDGLFGLNTIVQDIYGRGWVGTYASVPAQVIVSVINDNLIQGNRDAGFLLSNPRGADQFYLGGENIPLGSALGRSRASFTVVDDDRKPGVLGFASSTFTVNENGTNALITVIRTNGSSGSISVRYATANGTAIADSDYRTVSGTLIFQDGQTNKTFLVPIINDSAVEPDETVNLLLSSVNGSSIGLSNAVLTIIDDDFLPGRINFSTAGYATNEDAGAAVITVTRTGGSVGVLTVDYTTSDGTAISGLDYMGSTNTLSWDSGDTSPRNIIVRLVNDGLVEDDETVFLRLFNPSVAGALGSRTNATLGIVNDDFYGHLQFSTQAYRVNENGGAATIAVVRTDGSAESVAVSFATSNGTAYAGADYTPTNGTLIFGPGELSKTFSVFITDNPWPDGHRWLTLQLSNPTPTNAAGFPSTAILTIIDNETVNEPAGSPDTAFDTSTGMDGGVLAVALTSDGKILAGGDFNVVNRYPRGHVVRLNAPDGSLDNNFLSTFSGANGSVRAVVSQTDDRVVIGGAFTAVNGVVRNRIARLNYDGALDTTFNPGSGTDNPVYALAETFVAGARKIMLGGSFTVVNSQLRHGVVRLNDDGTVDTTFNPGSGPSDTVHAVAVYPTNSPNAGKVLIGGDFILVNGAARNRIARLNADGSVDTSFDPGTGANDSVRAIAIQLDGRVLIGGMFTNVNGAALNRVARLNNDGSVDSSFTPGVGANDAVYAIAVQGDTRIVVGGEFTQASGVTRRRLTRLNADGTVDPTINFGTGANNFVAAVVVQDDGKLVIGGGFTEFDGLPRQRIARLYGGSMAGSGSFTFTAAAYEANENATNAIISVRRSGGTSGAPPTGNVSVDFATSDGTAIAGTHYIGVTNTLVFPLGETFQTVSVPILDDIEINANRTVNLRLTNPAPVGLPSLGIQPTAWLTIVNDDSAVSFSSVTYSRNENAIDGRATIQVVRTGSTTGSASVEFATTTNGAATAGLDYVAVTNTIVFAPGETNKSITIPIFNDTLVEGNEAVTMELRNPMGTLLFNPSQATLTIIDDDFAPGQLAFSAPAYFVSEGGTNATITVIRTNGWTGVVTVNFASISGTATPGSDYAATNGALVFGDGEMSKTFAVPILQDTLVEGDEQLSVVLSEATGGATIIGPNQVPLTIVDDDVGLSFSSLAYVVSEGEGSATLTVLRQNGSNGVVSVNYATTNGTAVAGADYSFTSGTLIFNNGETRKTFTVSILEDALVEGDETFTVVLSNPTGGAQLAAPSSATIVIIDNDAGLSFATNMFVVDETGTNTVITVIRTNANTGTVSVNYVTADDTATAGADYGGASGTLVFTNGESVKTFAVPIFDDRQVEGDETFTVTLFNPTSGAQLLDPSTAPVTIVDNDSGLRFSSPTYTVSESGVSSTITVLRSNFTNSVVSVDFSTADGTATAGQDYGQTFGTLVFTNGDTSKTFTVSVIDDTVIEGDETVLLKLFNPTGEASLLSPSAATLTIVDNDGSLIVPAGSALTAEANGSINGVIDPGETVTLLFAFRNTTGANTTNLVATLLSTNGITAPIPAQTDYGVLTVGGPSVSCPFTFTASGTNGERITATFQLQDGGNNLGMATFTYTLGTTTMSFSNSSPLTIRDFTNAVPYPSVINIAGLDGVVSKVTMILTNLSHPSPADVDMLLVGPVGQSMIPMSDTGGQNAVNSVTLTFDDAATNSLPNSAQIVSGTFKPTNYLVPDNFPAPAPPSPYGAAFSVFNGSNPNGAWSLYIVDDTPLDAGSIAQGWGLTMTILTPIAAASDLSLTMIDSPDPVIVTSNLTYTLLITNHGPSTANAVTVSDTLPAGVNLISVSPSQGDYTTNGGGVIVWNVGTLAKDSAAALAVTVQPIAAGIITNSATATAAEADPNSANSAAAAVTVVSVPTADLVVGIDDSPDPVLVWNNLTYTVGVTNLGPATASNVRLTNTLPPTVTIVSASPVGYTVSGRTVTFTNLGNVGSGAKTTATIVVRTTTAGILTNTASASSSVTDPLKANNTASVKTIVEPLLLRVGSAGGDLMLAWPVEAANCVVESTDSLEPPVVWTQVTNPASVTVDGQKVLTVPMADGEKFFRLREPTP